MTMRKYLSWIATTALLLACDSPLETEPTSSIDAENALTTPRGIELALNGVYRSLQTTSLYSQEEMAFADLYADNLVFTGTFGTHREFGLRSLTANNGAVLAIWQSAYIGINRANNVLDAIPKVAALTDAQRTLYRGEALFVRSLQYAILVRDFGDVPIVTTPSRGVTEESLVSRDPRADVYALIEADLEEAVTLLPPGRVTGRATQGAANALLARVYLEEGKYTQARDKATLVINDASYALMPSYSTTVGGVTRVSFFATENSAESIFELQYSLNHSNLQAFWFFTAELNGRWGYAPSLGLFNAFEAGDARRDASIGIDGLGRRYGNKYFRIALGDDNVIVLRLPEMYLIRAEANAREAVPDPVLVRGDIDVVRNRAGLADLPTTITAQVDLFNAILQERRVEYAFEGHRFWDLRRMGVAQTVLGLTADRLLYPIPQAERDVNPNLTQNPGY
jgi:starch-binding outer membrane protein, SusD/RagB family